MARSIAYRRAQQKRMIKKAREIYDTDSWFYTSLINGEWVKVLYDPHVEAKKIANNMAFSPQWMRHGYGEKTRSQLKRDVSTRQQMEELI